MIKTVKKILPIEIENSPILKGISIPNNKQEREQHFLTFKKFVEKNRNTKKFLNEIDYILGDISLYQFNSSVMKYMQDDFNSKIKPELIRYITEVIALNKIIIDIVLQKQKVLYMEEYKLEKEYNLKIKILIVNIESIMKNMLSKKQMGGYRLTSGDMDNILKEIKSYLNAELVWLKNTKKSYFEKGLKTDNLGLGFYKFNNN
ncbi:MAG: hypothetical protein N4A38_00595 [Candidatus Gracilibacteria bacterium]|nr:hypothetical protein [Candidatus Gracilibacteria bacterium]